MKPHLSLPGFSPVSAAAAGLFSRGWLLLVAAVSTACFLLIINNSWNATPDSALYLALGESLAHGQGYVFNGEPHTFVPPGYPLILAGTAKLMGTAFLSYRVVMALLGLLTALSGYLLIWRLCGRDAALMIGGTFALNHALLSNSAFVLSDVPFALFTMLALHAVLSAALSDRRLLWILVAGLAVGLLPIVRINGLGVPPVAALCFFCSWKDIAPRRRVILIAVFLVIAFAPAVLWQWWKASFPVSLSEGTYLDAVAARRFGDQVHVIFTTFVGYFEEISYALTGVVIRTGFVELIAPVLVAVGMVAAVRNGDRLLVPLTVVQFGGLLLSSPGSRYVIFMLPALYLFLALGILAVCDRMAAVTAKTLDKGKILAFCFALLALLNVGHDVGTIVQARTALESGGAESERSLPFFVASRWLKANAAGATVLTTRARIIHYLAGCPTVTLLRSGVPDHEIWVGRKDQIELIMTTKNPEYLFTDSASADLYAQVMRALEELGMKLEEIPEASISQRFQLYRIVRSGESARAD